MTDQASRCSTDLCKSTPSANTTSANAAHCILYLIVYLFFCVILCSIWNATNVGIYLIS